MADRIDDLHVLGDLPLGVLPVGVAGVGLEEVDLPDPHEGTGLLGLVPEGVDDLEDLEGEVLVGPDPEGEHGVHGGLGGGPEDQPDVEGVETRVGDPVDLLVESLDVVLLLLKLRFGNQKRE